MSFSNIPVEIKSIDIKKYPDLLRLFTEEGLYGDGYTLDSDRYADVVENITGYSLYDDFMLTGDIDDIVLGLMAQEFDYVHALFLEYDTDITLGEWNALIAYFDLLVKNNLCLVGGY